jgi:hypothetical protein
MKKMVLASLTVSSLLLGATHANASLSCNDPLTSSVGSRFCVEKFENLAPGAYNVSFDYQAARFAGNADRDLSFGWLFGTDQGEFSRGVLRDSTATTGINTYSFLARISDDAALLFALRGVPGPNFGLALSNIQVTAVPEPGTFAMLLAGLGAIVFVSRRRRRL